MGIFSNPSAFDPIVDKVNSDIQRLPTNLPPPSLYCCAKNILTVLRVTLTQYITVHLKGHGNEPNFPRFLHKSVWHRSLTLHFEPFRFWLQILGDIHIRKMTPRLNDTGSRWLSVSKTCRVDDSPTQRYRELTTLRITDTQSRRLPASPIRRVGYWIF